MEGLININKRYVYNLQCVLIWALREIVLSQELVNFDDIHTQHLHKSLGEVLFTNL